MINKETLNHTKLISAAQVKIGLLGTEMGVKKSLEIPKG
jgi:hypothetical protein